MTNHLEGRTGLHVDLLRELTDEQLAEQIEYYQYHRSITSGRDGWGWSKLLSTATLVLEERNGGPTIEEREAEIERLEEELGI